MSLHRRHVLPRLLHFAMGQEALLRHRRRAIGAAEGRGLEGGFGSGLNLPPYGPSVRQGRFDPLWRRMAGGCHLNRKIGDLIEHAGFHIDTFSHAWLPGPHTHTFAYQGRAQPA